MGKHLSQSCDEHPDTTCTDEIIAELMAAFPGAELITTTTTTNDYNTEDIAS